MSTTTTLSRRRNPIALLTGIFDVLIALTVLAGYAGQDAVLVTLVPGSAPMRLTTAIGILCCGSAVLLLAGGFSRTAAAAAAVCGAVGLINAIEVIGDFRIIGSALSSFAPATPPRAGALIACLLILAAAGLMLMSGIVKLRARLAAVGFAGSVLFSVGAVAAVSYVAGVSSAFTTGAYSQLAIHTSVALAALGAALIRFAWRDSLGAEAGTPAWLPMLICTGTLTTAFCLYAAILSDQKSDFARQISFDSEGLQQYLQAALENRIQPLIRLARHRAVTPDLKKDDWDADTQIILTRGGYQGIEWIDAAGRIVWTSPPGAGDNTPDGNAVFEPRRRAAFDAARKNRALAATRPIDLVTGGKGTVVVVPVFVKDELAGYVAGVFRYQLLFQNLLSSDPSPQYAIAVLDGAEPVFSRGVPNRSSGLVQTMDLPAPGTKWKLEIGPTESLVVQARSPLGGALLVTGAFLAVLFSLLVRLAQRPAARPFSGMALQSESSPALAGTPADVSRLPVVSYGSDGTALAWNEAAKVLFAGAPPRIHAFETGFRTLHATLLRTSASPICTEPLRVLLESCAAPALVFDPERKFMAANPAAATMLGWSDAVWKGRTLGTILPAGSEPLEIYDILMMQGRWAVPAPPQAAAAAAAR